jgi:glycosyltransferase involved in cell wall biosynthesis
MISTEYPPMQGGVGRYSKKLVDSLRKEGLEIIVVSNEDGDGDLNGISPYNTDDSEILLKLVKSVQPDLVHIQYEPGLYGIRLAPINPRGTRTNIDSFYHDCMVPIITTFHSGYTFSQWMNLIVPLANRRFGKVGTLLGMAYNYWTHLINYKSSVLVDQKKIGPRRVGIVFSKYLANLIPGTHLIYHGSESSISPPVDRKHVRQIFCLPQETKLALATGFMTATKGWDIIKKMKVPDGWSIVINGSRNHYNRERPTTSFDNIGVIDLRKGYLDDRQLSLLLYSVDALILPYRVTSGSGAMFDGFAHELPFVSSNIAFFRVF